MKKYVLPVIAAAIIALLVVPTGAFAALPAGSSSMASVVTIPEDNAKLNMGVMVLGLDPTYNWGYLYPQKQWYTDSMCQTPVAGAGVLVGPEMSDEPILDPLTGLATTASVYYQAAGGVCVKHYFTPAWPKPYAYGWDLLSQHKILATLNGVPTKPDYVLCEVVEKEKAKIPPMTSKTPSLRQFPDEIIKTTLIDVTSNFVCKVNWIKPGVGALDVYFVGPHVSNFIADHMLIVTVGYKVNRSTVWASDLQDICILGWSMGANTLAVGLFINPGLSAAPAYAEIYWSWDDALGPFVSCDEAAAWQLVYYTGGWPYAIVA
jgi:hypothetical protein